MIDPTKTHLTKELKHNSPLVGCRFDPAGSFVFAGAQDNSIQRWALADDKKTVCVGHKSWVRALAFQGEQLFSGDWAGKILVWKLAAEKPEPIATIDAHKGWVRALAVSPDGKLLASSGNDNLIKLWSTADFKLQGELVGHDSHVYNVAFHPAGKNLASCDHKGVIKDWDLGTQKAQRTIDAAELQKFDPVFRAIIGGARAMEFSPDGSLLACAGITNVTNAFAGVGKPVVLLFDWAAGKKKQALSPKENFQGTGWGVICHPQGFLAGVGGGNGGALWFWKPDQAASYHTLKLPNSARDLCLHPGGVRLAIPFYDGAVRLYDMTEKKAEPKPPEKKTEKK
ncbi:MAG: WD40 repeat domain-containing protein [Gemmataceae bacterium]